MAFTVPLKDKYRTYKAFKYGKYVSRTGNSHGKGRQWRNDANVHRVKKASTSSKG